MKKTKNLKGFTLVELIVVMAIIGVLAAVLVPGLLGYMKDSRISAANQNAHAVFTAFSSWQAKEVAANDNASAFAAKDATIAGAAKGSTAINPTTTATGVTVPNMRDKLGEGFYGNAMAVFSTNGDQVSYALWAATATPAVGQLKTSDQDAFSNTADIIGCSPLAS